MSQFSAQFSSSTKLALFVSVSVYTAERDVKAFASSGILAPQPGQHFSGLLTGGGVHVEILEMGYSQHILSDSIVEAETRRSIPS